MKETFDLYQYQRVMWRGFNHELKSEGEFFFSKEKEETAKNQVEHPNVHLNLKIAVVAPLTETLFRICGNRTCSNRSGLSDGIRKGRCFRRNWVQQFYYSIGLRPHSTCTEWRMK